jgi:hypothetical protein
MQILIKLISYGIALWQYVFQWHHLVHPGPLCWPLGHGIDTAVLLSVLVLEPHSRVSEYNIRNSIIKSRNWELSTRREMNCQNTSTLVISEKTHLSCHHFFPVASKPFLLLDDIARNRNATIEFWCCPLQINTIDIPVDNFRSSWFARGICVIVSSNS